MIAARAAAALGDAAVLVVAVPGKTVDSVLNEVRLAMSGSGESVLILISDDVAALDRAMLRAAIGPLAIEAAPMERINAIDIGTGADVDVIIATASFLAAARSTTGQILSIGG